LEGLPFWSLFTIGTKATPTNSDDEVNAVLENGIRKRKKVGEMVKYDTNILSKAKK